MIKKISTLILAITIFASANVFASARVDGSEGDNVEKTVSEGKKNLKAIFAAKKKKPFDPASRKSTLADHQSQQKLGKKFSTTSKVLIGVGIAAAVAAVVVVVARKDLKDNILR